MSLDALLEAFRRGEVDAAELKRALLEHAARDVGCANVDHQRLLRTGHAESVYCPGKTPEQVRTVLAELAERSGRALATRADAAQAAACADLPGAAYDPVSRLITLGEPLKGRGEVLVVSAGTADLPVAQEAAGTAEFLGSRVTRRLDCGVAGIHRLFAAMEDIARARVVVAVADMDGALASVLGGLAPCPVLAVPTSVGYGAGLGGVAALMTMLNACAPGVSVVNIDNGYGAGFQAHLINTAGAGCR